MKITAIECIPLTVNYKKSRLQHGRVIPGAPRVVVKIHTDEGIVGVSESGTTAIGYTGDSQESIIGFIRTLGPKILLGEDPLNIERLVTKLDAAAKYSNQALAVIDCALHDLVGKKLGVPVYQLLGGLSNEKIRLGWVLGYGTFVTPDDAAERSRMAVDAGFRSIKLKVGRGSVEEDIANIEAIRESVGYDIRLGIDANCCWDYSQALEALKKMEKYDIFMVEQPVPWREIDNLARLRQKVGIPICADESATELSHLFEILEKDAVDVLFIKLMKVGGLRKAQKWAAIAEAAGIPVMCGCMVGSSFEAASQAHFLAANAWMGHMEQENLGPLIVHNVFDTVNNTITDDLGKNVPRYENGFMYPPSGPGLGVELNEELLPSLITPGISPLVVGDRG